MVQINKVYTKTGDKGETSLVGGRRVPKDDQRIEAYGTIDELNSILGVARSLSLRENQSGQWDQFHQVLLAIQQKLFDIGSELATHHEDDYPGKITADPQNTSWLEGLIDQLNDRLSPLQSFVLPGGELLNGYLHQARTVCRRAERETLRFNRNSPVNPNLIAFLNRLSDLLFVLARWVCYQKESAETLWQPESDLPVFDF